MQANATAGTEGAQAFARREQRLKDAIALRVPDRVPVAFTTGFWHARHGQRTVREVMYDHQLNAECFRRAIVELEPDGATPTLTSLGGIMEAMGYRPMRWPGHGAPDNVSFQYLDTEVMKADEYDAFIEDPTYYYLTRYLPRISDALVPLAKLPHLPQAQNLRLFPALRAFADPEVMQALAKLPEIGAEAQRLVDAQVALNQQMFELGFPSLAAAGCPCPYDYFADYLRGSKGIMLDMYRRKDKLLEAMEFILPILTRNAIAAGKAGRTNVIFMALHWGLDGFMSVEQFKTFYWPFLRRQILAQVEAGVVPCIFWEGDCTSRLEIIGDIPKGKAIYWFERTDIHRAKEVLGEVACLRGGVPASLLTVGKPDEVREHCRRLIQTVGKDGGYILDGGGGGGIPDEAPVENVRAMFAAAHEQ